MPPIVNNNILCVILINNNTILGILIADSNMHGKSQYFIESPRNQTVNEGDTVLLKCQVGNLQGIVQWTRAGFAMGEIKKIVILMPTHENK